MQRTVTLCTVKMWRYLQVVPVASVSRQPAVARCASLLPIDSTVVVLFIFQCEIAGFLSGIFCEYLAANWTSEYCKVVMAHTSHYVTC